MDFKTASDRLMRSAELFLVATIMTGCGDSPLEIVVTEIPTYSAVSTLESGGIVQVTITARNETDRAVHYSIRVPCGVFVRVHRDAARSGPAWDQWAWLNMQTGGCKGLAVERILRPGGSETFMPSAAVDDILGDSLPSGRYFVSGMIIQDVPDLGRVDIAAGELDLVAP